mmetsp:Transcript_18142/g.37189  ORF Transcript_18142/g.37189 Transcript_18142/m.37189 type:complete len:431 (+) Transcript_18142:251-1543(+)
MAAASIEIPRQLSPHDFLFGEILGEGRFGRVVYAELKSRGEQYNDNASANKTENDNDIEEGHQRRRYAIKIIPKSAIFRHKLRNAVMTEKFILSELLTDSRGQQSSSIKNACTADDEIVERKMSSELIIKLFSCFHDVNSLYFVLELCAGGTLLDLINSRTFDSHECRIMDISWARYYAAQILRTLEFMHSRGVVHRDISCQNIGLTYPIGGIKLLDFGSAVAYVDVEQSDGSKVIKMWEPSSTRKGHATNETLNDFVGTADYVSPEMIRGCSESVEKTLGHAMDLWSFGCVLFHMTAGKSPFHAETDHLAIQKVLNYANGKRELQFPADINEDLRSLIASLLSTMPEDRLGALDKVFRRTKCSQDQPANCYCSIRNHEFFCNDLETSIWKSLETGSLEPPYKPPEPKWMRELMEKKKKLRTIDYMAFDL